MGVQESKFQIQGKNSIGSFYSRHFPEGMYKLKQSDIKQAEDYLEKTFSNDVSVTVFLSIIKEKETNHTFEHLSNWNQLTTQKKANLMVINNMIQLICVADFSFHYFKEILSLCTDIEKLLNKDTRLDMNAPQDKHPNLKNVILEIQRTRTNINLNQDDGKDSFKAKSSDYFSPLGLTTNRLSQLMSVKGKPITFKSRSKGAMDINIQNPEEFSRLLDSEWFQRQHMSSLLSQVFNPAFIFNPVYHNVAKFINRRILTSSPKPLAITKKVLVFHFSVLRKLSQLFFETQKLSTRNLLYYQILQWPI